MKNAISAIFLTAVIIALPLLSACGIAVDEDEILSAFSELAPAAQELYLIVYGDGLAHEEEMGSDGYYAVSADARYQSIAELKGALRGVFSEGYAQVLENTAFCSVSNEDEYIYAKFIEKDGVMYVNPKATEDFGEPREFELSKARIVQANRYKAIVAVPDGDGELEVAMQKQDGVWLIDGSLY